MTDWLDDRADRVTAPGSRARTRELGYADAVLDMLHRLQDLEAAFRRYEIYAIECGSFHAADILGEAGLEVRRYARYAGGLYDLHIDDKPPGHPKSVIGWGWGRVPARHETGSFPVIG